MEPSSNAEALQLALTHIKKLLYDSGPPEIPQELEGNADFKDIHDYVHNLRDVLGQFAASNFTASIKTRGVIAGRLKALQANLRHMLWQIQQLENGDFSQRIDFMGDLSQSFNNMVAQLHTAITEMKEKEISLTELSENLEQKVEQRNQALHVLKRREAEFKYLAEHDPLTGVLNRRSFFECAERVLRDDNHAVIKYSLAILDIDKFKDVNDTYGHLEGDIALKHVATLAKKGLRKDDIMARYGGEEFVFLFPNANEKQSKNVAERIRISIEEFPVVLAKGTVPITVSLGVTTFSAHTWTNTPYPLLKQAIKTADLALYRSKDTGRNKVTFMTFNPAATVSSD